MRGVCLEVWTALNTSVTTLHLNWTWAPRVMLKHLFTVQVLKADRQRPKIPLNCLQFYCFVIAIVHSSIQIDNNVLRVWRGRAGCRGDGAEKWEVCRQRGSVCGRRTVPTVTTCHVIAFVRYGDNWHLEVFFESIWPTRSSRESSCSRVKSRRQERGVSHDVISTNLPVYVLTCFQGLFWMETLKFSILLIYKVSLVQK